MDDENRTDEKLRRLMERAGIDTFGELAERTGITSVSLYYYRTQQRTPALKTAARLATVLHVPIDVIVETLFVPTQVASYHWGKPRNGEQR